MNYSITEAARRLNVPPNVLRLAIKRGLLDAYDDGKRVTRCALREFCVVVGFPTI